ncbi:MAG TPA: hypothetical protein VJ327_00175 [Patescibacteria group bacterium]|nr:hypothetical protein [Patescibacteria group bacterium]
MTDIKPKVPETKTFSFSKEDLEFLQGRQMLINQQKLLINDIDFVMQQFIINSVIPRIGIDPSKWNINFNVNENKISCTKKPPELIKPENGIVVPK